MKEKFENENCSEKLRDSILFHNHNNAILNNLITKIISENKLDYLIKDSDQEKKKLELQIKELDIKFVN